MKIAFLLVFITCLNVSAKVFSQEKLTLDLKNIKLEKALQTIEKQSSYRFVYSPTEGPFNKVISIKTNQASLEEVMRSLLSGTSLSFTVQQHNLITILKAEMTNQDVVVKGVVKDSTGLGLPGVTITVKGIKGIGTSTDGDGKFSIKVPNSSILVFSAIGFTTVEEPASGSMNIVMKALSNNLDEVVVQAYGTTTKRKTTSSISTLDMTTIASIPVQSINDGVAGRLPGITVTATNGAPGSKSSISIRGGGTPLFVIDNVIRSESDFANLNPNDIEDYSLLKDAAATALYGVSASNGVLLVTTKRGKEGKTSINYAYNQIFSQPTLFPDRLSSFEQQSALNRLFVYEGKPAPIAPQDLEKYRDGADPLRFPNTDWQDLTMKNFSPEMRHDLSMSAGTKLLSYYASLSYYNQGTILKTDKNSNKRTTYRLNATSDFEKANLKVNVGLDGFIEKNIVPVAGYAGIYSHIQDRLSYELAKNEFGLPTPIPDNPVRELDPLSGYNKGAGNVLNANLSLAYSAHFLKGLKFKINGVYNTYNTQGKVWNFLAPGYLIGSTAPVYGNAPSLTVRSDKGNMTTLQGYVIYNKTFGDHAIDFTAVYEQTKGNYFTINAARSNYQILYDQLIAGPTENQSINIFDGNGNLLSGESENARAALLGRLSYNYKSKYSFEASVRRDGDYLFVPGSQWGTFFALSAGYTLSEEGFMKSLKDKHILDFLKIRGSYGILGNKDGINPFRYVSAYSVTPIAWFVDGKAVQGTSEPTSIPSQSYSWQQIADRNIAIDLASFNNRLTATVEYYYKRTTGYVTSDPRFANTLGIKLPLINFSDGAARKEGFDFNMNWQSKQGQLSYKIGFNYNYFNTAWERNASDSDADLKNPFRRRSSQLAGFLVDVNGNAIYGYKNNGFYTDNGQLLSGARLPGASGVAAGDLRYIDTNGDGQITADDQTTIGNNTFPRTNYGITLDLGYKGFFFSAVVQGSGNRDRYLGSSLTGQTGKLMTYGFQEDYWRPDNTDALFPRATTSAGVNGGNNYQTSDFWLIQSKYVRLKYLQVGYDFKKGVFQRSPFQQLRLFVSGTNILTSAKSQKYFIDPEADPSNYNYPIQRTFAIGINAGF
ncbi:SusC/RagA family TonB-linked outer membrane protein [Pedobacter sp. GSP4]|uniref:SusC/RagA family TonB-linked outer membrane protein n=1 Tax=Pedobacter sp. GSP4 TaxID=3453716 RepID=UPI003EEDAEA2